MRVKCCSDPAVSAPIFEFEFVSPPRQPEILRVPEQLCISIAARAVMFIQGMPPKGPPPAYRQRTTRGVPAPSRGQPIASRGGTGAGRHGRGDAGSEGPGGEGDHNQGDSGGKDVGGSRTDIAGDEGDGPDAGAGDYDDDEGGATDSAGGDANFDAADFPEDAEHENWAGSDNGGDDVGDDQ